MLLAGCKGENRELEQMMTFRASLLSGMGCSFQAVITADYQQEIYQFTLDCRCDEQGTLRFTVVEPESISGIRGLISAEGGKLTFDDDEGLAFGTLADGQVTPVTAPWLLIKTLRGGYVTSCGMEDDFLRVSIDDSYQENALQLDVWFSADNLPKHAEILWADRRILSLEVTNFEIL
jgi:hypothetical protein